MATALKIPASKITEETRKEDLPQWDSLAHLNLMMTLEQTFDITLEVEDFDRLDVCAAHPGASEASRLS